jgi:hypothetical protein
MSANSMSNRTLRSEGGFAQTGRMAVRQVELAKAEEALAESRRQVRAAVPASSSSERGVILAAVDGAYDLPERERYAARAAAAQELRDLITELRCHEDGSLNVWQGEWGFRVQIAGNEAWIEGGVPVGRETLALKWDSRAGVVAAPFLPPIS